MSEAGSDNLDVLCRAEGALGHITLNRPKALNALTVAMRSEIAQALTAWQRDPMIYSVVIDAVGDRAFCAGGDLHEMHRMARDTPDSAREAAAAEYALNWQIDCYTKPIVSLIDGLCMGSGVGLTAYGTHRVAGAGYAFAMPETAIGFFPDVGATWLLAGLPGRAGLYLGLSGRAIDRAAALRLGLVSHCIPSEQFDEIRTALQDAEPVDALLDERAVAPEVRDAAHDWTAIANLFDVPRLPALLQRLSQVGTPFASALFAELQQKSPLSLAVTFQQLTENPPAELENALRREYRQAVHALGTEEFREGVRAMLIDKDQKPQWMFDSVSAVEDDAVAAYFAPLATGELELPARPEAIAAIA